MFNIGPWELALVFLLALLVLGPGKLPQLGSALGQTLREFRKATQGLAGDLTSEQETKRTSGDA